METHYSLATCDDNSMMTVLVIYDALCNALYSTFKYTTVVNGQQIVSVQDTVLSFFKFDHNLRSADIANHS